MLKKTYDYVIVGSGIFGSTFAHQANKHGKRCLVIEKRDNIGGNIRCENIEGITVHTYGPHIFHTSDEEVWNFVNRFVHFNNYINSPLANYKGELYNLPFNMNTFKQLWGIKTPNEAIDKISEERFTDTPLNLEEQALSMVGKTIFNKLIKGYTEKQWGRDCRELPTSIIKRLPLRMQYNNNYFNDKYQGIPIEGYNVLIEKLLEGIEVKTNCNFFDNREKYKSIGKKIIFTGPIDAYFNYCYGKLEYRSLRFETETLGENNFQGVAVMNYTDKEIPYTRITEHKHFLCQTTEEININPKTVITKEYPEEYNGKNEPIYPIPTEENLKLYSQYKELAKNYPNIIFCGRLGEYKYLDMGPIIRKALDLWKNEEENSSNNF